MKNAEDRGHEHDRRDRCLHRDLGVVEWVSVARLGDADERETGDNLGDRTDQQRAKNKVALAAHLNEERADDGSHAEQVKCDQGGCENFHGLSLPRHLSTPRRSSTTG